MVTQNRKDFSVASLLRENNNDCQLNYSLESSSSNPISISILKGTKTTPTHCQSTGEFSFCADICCFKYLIKEKFFIENKQ